MKYTIIIALLFASCRGQQTTPEPINRPDIEIYTGNDDILYITRYATHDEITSESTLMNLKVTDKDQTLYIIADLADPCSTYEYYVKIDSLQNIY